MSLVTTMGNGIAELSLSTILCTHVWCCT